MIKICMYCCKEFETNISNKKYCSVECRNKYCNRRQHKKIMTRNIDNPTSNKNLEDWCLCAGEFGLNLLKEYSNKNSLPASKISAGTRNKAYWKCSKCGYEWSASVEHRANRRQGCPVCSGRVVTDDYNLYKWCMDNGDFGKQLIEEYSKDNDTDMKNLFPFSSMYIKWECKKCGCRWETKLSHRTRYKTGCPKCSNKVSTSFGEQIIYYILKRELPQFTVLNREKVNNFEIDIFIPELKLGIEYSGYKYHINKLEHDKEKLGALKNAGYNILIILEHLINDNLENIKYDFEFSRTAVLDEKPMLEYIREYLDKKYGISINTSMTYNEIDKCKEASQYKYIDICEIEVLRALGYDVNTILNMLGCSYGKVWKDIIERGKLSFYNDISDIKEIISSLRLGYSPEEIASNSVEADTSIFEFDVDDKTYDLDFVLKIKSLLEKYEAI